MLTLSDELFLLSLEDKKNGVGFSNRFELPYAMAGAVLFELIQQGKIRLEGKRVQVVNATLKGAGATPTGSDLSNELLERLASARKPKKLVDWVMAFGEKSKKLSQAALADLVRVGILRTEEKRILWVFPYTGYDAQDSSAKYALKSRLRGLVLGREPPDEHSVALLSLARAADLLDHLFTRDELRQAKKRVEALVKDEAIGQGVQEAVDAVSAAVATIVVATTSFS
jgi:golgi phosphoprotein 3